MKKYRMLEVIGDGTYGTVWKGVFIETGEKVAIKKLKNKIKTWNECVEMKEVKALSKLKAHPNIIKLKEVIRETNSEAFLVFEYADTNLYEYIESVKKRGETIPEIKIKEIIHQIANGLSYTHLNGYFHRDLKPENILLMINNSTGEISVKIADFGLAREIPSYYNNIPLTEYVCTRWYRSPECILKSTSYSSAMDIWALGCIMAELYMLTPIFPGNSEFDQLAKVTNIFGAPKFNEWPEGYKLIQKLGMKFSNSSGVHLSTLINNASVQGINLLYEVFNWDPLLRPNCSKLMSNVFFNEVKTTSNTHHNRYTSSLYCNNPSYAHDNLFVQSNSNYNSLVNNNSSEDYLNNFNYKSYRNNNNTIPEIYSSNNNNYYNSNYTNNNIPNKSKLSYLAENDLKLNKYNSKMNVISTNNNSNGIYYVNKNDYYGNSNNFYYDVPPNLSSKNQKTFSKSDIENQINNIAYQRQNLFNYPQIYI